MRDPLQYPFDVPTGSFVWSAGRAESNATSMRVDEVSAERHPVLAIGSNAAPSQLTRKFNDKRFTDPATPEGSIPVFTAVVEGVDVVYGAHVASYGSLPATLLDTPGASAHVFITWLTPLQLEQMNETEGLGHAYHLRHIDRVRCHGEDVGPVPSYVTVAGVCALGGGPLGLATIHAPGSPWPRGTQRQAWDQLADDMGCDVDGSALLARVLATPAWRERVESHIAAHRLPGPRRPVEL